MSSKYHSTINIPVKFNLMDVYPMGTVVTKDIEIKIDNDILVQQNKDLVEWLRSVGLRIEGARYFESVPNTKYKIHVDTPDKVAVKINFIYDSFDSTMIWYNLLPNKEKKYYTNIDNDILEWYDIKEVQEIFRTSTDTTCLINAGEIHQLINSDNRGINRKCFSLKLEWIDKEEKLTWDDAVKVFKNYLGS